jgi:hypothetical protein
MRRRAYRAFSSVPCVHCFVQPNVLCLFCSAATQSATLFECTPRFPRGGGMQSAPENTALEDCTVRSTAMSCKPRSLTSTARKRTIILCQPTNLLNVTNLLRAAHILAGTLKNVMSTSKSCKDSDKGLNVPKFDHGSTDGKGEKWQKWLTLLSSAFGQSYPMFAMQLNDVPEPIDSPDGSKL